MVDSLDIPEQIRLAKERIPLRAVLEREGIELKRLGAALVCCCPFHVEDTPSMHVHDEAGGGWFKCFGCDAKGDVITYLRLRHGGSVKDALERLTGNRPISQIQPPAPRKESKPEVVVEPLGHDGLLAWEAACARVSTDPEELSRWAAWRGLRPEVISWAARQWLCGKVIYQNQWREAFAIIRADGAQMGEHVRLAPKTRGNDTPRASWRYRPGGIGAWPFRILPEKPFGVSHEDFMAGIRYVFVCEGQWDALALVDVMGWETSFPSNAAVFGLRGATSFVKLLESFPKVPHPLGLGDVVKPRTFFLIADHDRAGAGWFSGGKSFSLQLEEDGHRVHGFWPALGIKDLNDAVKGFSPTEREAFRDLLRSKIPAKRKKVKPPFRRWLSSQRSRGTHIAAFAARALMRGGASPKGNSPLWKWEQFLKKCGWEDLSDASGETRDLMAVFYEAWDAWNALSTPDAEKISPSTSTTSTTPDTQDHPE